MIASKKKGAEPMNNAVWAAIIAGATLLGVLVGTGVEHVSRERELDIKMIETALGILSVKPEPSTQPVRVWAMDVIDQYSDVKLSPDARRVLLNEPLPGAFGTMPLGRGLVGRGPLGR